MSQTVLGTGKKREGGREGEGEKTATVESASGEKEN